MLKNSNIKFLKWAAAFNPNVTSIPLAFWFPQIHFYATDNTVHAVLSPSTGHLQRQNILQRHLIPHGDLPCPKSVFGDWKQLINNQIILSRVSLLMWIRQILQSCPLGKLSSIVVDHWRVAADDERRGCHQCLQAPPPTIHSAVFLQTSSVQ